MFVRPLISLQLAILSITLKFESFSKKNKSASSITIAFKSFRSIAYLP